MTQKPLTMEVRQPKTVIDAPWAWELQKLEEGIKANDKGNLEARWQYGRVLLQRRGDDKQLPHGALDLLVARDRISRSEIKYRMQFAATYPTKREVATAMATYRTWTAIKAALPKASPKPKSPVVGESRLVLRRLVKQVRGIHAIGWGEAEKRDFDELKSELVRIQEEINSTPTVAKEAMA